MPNFTECLSAVRKAIRLADQHEREAVREAGRLPDNHHQIAQSIFREPRDAGHYCMNDLRKRVDYLRPLARARVRAHLQLLDLQPLNPAQDTETAKLEKAIDDVVFPMSSEGRGLRHIEELCADCTCIGDLRRISQAADLIQPYEQFESIQKNKT